MNVNTLRVIGGDWLKDRDNYDIKMAEVNGWECHQSRHYDVIINGRMVEVKKTKSASVIIKYQQLAEIYRDGVPDVDYMIVRTNKTQTDIHSVYVVPAKKLMELTGLDDDLCTAILKVHHTLGTTIQGTISTTKLKEFKIQ